MITQQFSHELKLSPWRAFLIISLFFLGSLSAQADTNRMESGKHSGDRKLVSTVVERFASAWNKNDTETIAKTFSFRRSCGHAYWLWRPQSFGNKKTHQ
jgi:hypothetical protein